MSKKSLIFLSAIFLLIFIPGCTYYTFNIKKNTLLNTYKKNSRAIGSDWGFYIIGDKTRFEECLSSYKSTPPDQGSIAKTTEETGNKSAAIIFEKHRYILFFMTSDSPRLPISGKYTFTATDAKGNTVKISDVLFFTEQYDSDDKNKFDYCWLLRFDKTFTRENFSEDKLPIELVITDSPYTNARISINF
jgi:hypothetical protein